MSARLGSRLRRPRPVVVGVLAWVVGVASVVVMARVPRAAFVYRSFSMRIALETAESLIALLLAYLLYARFSVDRRRRHVLLAITFTLVAGTNLILTVLPATITSGSTDAFSGWALLVVRLLAAIGLLLAATRRPQAVSRDPMSAAGIVISAGLLLAAVAGGVAFVRPSLPVDYTWVAVLDDATGAAMVMAGLLFTVRARREDDELLTWLGGAVTLGGFARFLYAMAPSMSTQFVHPGDALRFAFYLVLMVGAGREIRAYVERSSHLAVAEAKRRIARDLHDGLAQELSYIAMLAKRMRGAWGSEQLASAAERALDESRRAIAALMWATDEPLEDLVSQAAEEVASRTGAVVHFDLAAGVHTSPETREVLLRVVREAVSNASRHGQAEDIRVTLARNGDVWLRVVDDGCGFDIDEVKHKVGKFGLVAMQERAAAVGGSFVVTSSPGRGTEVEVRVPVA